VLFDLYGTLVYEPPFEHCFPTLAGEIGVDLETYGPARQATVVDAMVGKLATPSDRARAILAALAREDADGLADRLARIEQEARWPVTVLYPDTRPVLSALRARGYPLGLVSDCTSLMGRSVVERLGLVPYFDAVALSHEVGYAKPHPAIYRAAFEALGVQPVNCLYVGDGNSDELNGAKALGMTTVRIDQEGGYGRMGCPADSDYLIVRLSELLDLPPFNAEHPGFPRLDVSWVYPDLAVGGRVDPLNVPRLKALGIGSVVDLRAEEADDPTLHAEHGIHFLHLPMPDEFPLTQEQLREGSRWVAAERAAGRRVLVHCQHGVGRSVMLVAAVLINEGIPPTRALEQIKARRPRVALNARQLAAVYEDAAARAGR
jgi:HAD superfamily hydrolase (TIGR01509 family)